MWPLTLRDLRYRRRRLVIAIAGTALVFGMALIMTGMSAGFRAEADRTLDALGADAYVLTKGVAGPFTSFSALPASLADDIRNQPAVTEADPLIVLRHTILSNGKHTDINVVGHRLGGLGDPPTTAGRRARAPGEAVVDASLGVPIGRTVTLQDRPFTVVGHTEGVTYLAGIAVVFISLQDAQAFAFDGQDFATSIAVAGRAQAPGGTTTIDRRQARDDLLRPLRNGIATIDGTQALLWLVAAIIIAAVVYLSALERVRDFAVLKAVGASSRKLFASLMLQSIVIALVAAAFAALIALALAPMFPLAIETPPIAFALLPVAAVVVGTIASLSGLKRAIDVDPALAFGSA